MKIRLSFKTPDVIGSTLEHMDIHDPDEKMDIADACKKFVKYGEYLTVEIDTQTGTAVVLPA